MRLVVRQDGLQKSYLVLAHDFDDKLVITGDEEAAAGVSGLAEVAESVAAADRREVRDRVDFEVLAEAIEYNGVIVLPEE